MIWLYIYLSISVTGFLLYNFTCIHAANEFRRIHPGINIPKRAFIENVGDEFRALLISFLPIYNIAWFLVFMFCNEEIVDKTIDKAYSKYVLVKEKEDNYDLFNNNSSY